MVHNRVLLTKGQNTTHLIKLTHGTASYIDPARPQKPLLIISAPAFINLSENAYNAPALKTIVAKGKAKTECIKQKASHLSAINVLKSKGIRKNFFPTFHHTHPSLFYELALQGQTLSMRRTQSVTLDEETLYLVVSGRLVVGTGHVNVMTVGNGEVLIGSGLQANADCANTVLHLITKALAKAILGQEYQGLEKLQINQHETYQKHFDRNSQTIRKIATAKSATEDVTPSIFANQIQRRMNMLQKFKRTRSCLTRSITPRLQQVQQSRKNESVSLQRSRMTHKSQSNSILSAQQSLKESRWTRKASIRQYYAIRQNHQGRATHQPGGKGCKENSLFKRPTVGRVMPFSSNKHSQIPISSQF